MLIFAIMVGTLSILYIEAVAFVWFRIRDSIWK